MTDPEDKPTFLARLAIVATVGVVVTQMGLCIEGINRKRNQGRAPSDDWAYSCLFPVLSFLAIACLYYLFKGQPMSGDATIASRLYRVWGVSVIIGAIYSFLI